MKRIDRTTTLEDLAANPHAYGLPSLDEYERMRESIWGRGEDAMAAISDGPQAFRKDLRKIILKVHGKELGSEEQVERALSDYGYTLADIDMENRNSRLKKTIDMVPQGGGKYDIVVNFLP